jgi:hypothetical protein
MKQSTKDTFADYTTALVISAGLLALALDFFGVLVK